MNRLFVLLLLVVYCFVAAAARPAVVHMPDGVYASPDDTTMQCLREDKRVCIGNENAARNITDLRLNRITHVFSAIGCLLDYYQQHGILCYSETIDDTVGATGITTLLAHTTSIIDAVLTANPNAAVLIHCAAGMSRSATITLAYMLYKDRARGFDGALHELRRVRSVVRPNPLFECVLRDYAGGKQFYEIDAQACKRQIPLLP